MVVLSEPWSSHWLPPNLQIGGIKLEDAYRVWLHPDRVREFNRVKLAAERRGQKDPEAFLTHVYARSSIIEAVWRCCLSGDISVRAKQRQAASRTIVYEFISADRLRVIWPHGPIFENSEYEDIELYGAAPPWMKITVDSQYYLGEFLVPEFQHVDDYSYVVMRGFKFELGPAQASVVRFLHLAVSDPRNWRYETEIQLEVQCGLISDLFKRHSDWPELIEKVGKGRYQLNLHSERGRPPAILSYRES